MKSNRLIVSFLLMMVSGLGLRAQSAGYRIDAHIGGLEPGERVFTKMMVRLGEYTAFDSTTVADGRFHLSGKVPVPGPRVYILTFSKHNNHSIWLYVDNGEAITIKATDINTLPRGRIQNDLHIDGSETALFFQRNENSFFLFGQIIGRINNKIRNLVDSIGFDPIQIGSLIAAKKEATIALYNGIVLPNLSNKGLVPALAGHLDPELNHAYFLPAVCSRVDKQRLNSHFGRIVGQRATLAVGQMLPAFELRDINGKFVSSSDVFGKNKLTLVHFWANKSFEVDAFQEDLRNLYKKYQQHGLQIVAISSDTSKKAWTTRVQVEDYPWINVSDLKGKDGVVENVYHEYNTNNVAGINNTTNVLIDDQGRIVAWDVAGPELQWYIWKYLEAEK